MQRIIGIDLGTTFSAVAYLAENEPRLIPNALGEVLTPSVVGVATDGAVVVGRAAKELQVVQPDRCVGAFKRYMGTDWTTEIGGYSFTPEMLSSQVLTALKRDAEAFFQDKIENVVITVPAYFNEDQRKATIRAGEIAGLNVHRILNEPTAAAIAYGWHTATAEQIIVVLDLGGGTFDVSIVDQFEGTLEVRASSGETFLGGEDFTNTLAARVLESKGLNFEQEEVRHPKRVSRLRQECEHVKRRLSRQESDLVRVPSEDGEFAEPVPTTTVTREQFERWTRHILNRIENPIRRALGDANINVGDVNELILVGGATRMPCVIQRATELFGRQPKCRLNPDEVVALGAAVQAGLCARDSAVDDLVVMDVAPFTLGIHVCRDVAGVTQDGYFLPIINRNTPIPTSRVERVSTVMSNQTSILVKVYQGEARKVEDNLYLGEFYSEGIPRGPAGQQVDIRFTYDLNGVLEIEATVVASKVTTSHVITRHASGLSPAEIEKAVADMSRLKSHPREQALNRFLVFRAERLYQEVPISMRRLLDSLLTGFEEALELQDDAAIASNRSALQEFLDQYDNEEQNEETYGDD